MITYVIETVLPNGHPGCVVATLFSESEVKIRPDSFTVEGTLRLERNVRLRYVSDDGARCAPGSANVRCQDCNENLASFIDRDKRARCFACREKWLRRTA